MHNIANRYTGFKIHLFTLQSLRILIDVYLFTALLGPLSLAVDVVYLLDSSDSVTTQHYDAQKSFVKQLSRYLNTMPDRTRGAVITYGSTATVITNFGDTSTTQEFYSAINNAPKVGGPRRMDSAIDSARNVFAKARPAVPKVVILLTTGSQAAGTQAGVLDKSFQRLYDLGARLYAVTISPQFIILPLRGSAGSDWFPVRSYINLPVYVMPLARHVSYDTGNTPNRFFYQRETILGLYFVALRETLSLFHFPYHF